MKVDFVMTTDLAIALAQEFREMWNPHIFRNRRIRIILAVGIACAFSIHRLPLLENTGTTPMVATVFLAVIIPVSIVFLLVFLFLSWISVLPDKLLAMIAKKRSSEFWGPRTLEIVDGRITFSGTHISSTFKTSFIKKVLETKRGYHLVRGKEAIVSIPRNACSFEELKKAVLPQPPPLDNSRITD